MGTTLYTKIHEAYTYKVPSGTHHSMVVLGQNQKSPHRVQVWALQEDTLVMRAQSEFDALR